MFWGMIYPRHTPEFHIGFKQFARLVAFAHGVIDPSSRPAGRVFRFPDCISVKVKKLAERKRKKQSSL